MQCSCMLTGVYSYVAGMHELLAPLAYVLHVDVNHLQHIKYQCEDRFDDPFDRFSAPWTTIMERSANVSIPRAAGGKETLSSNSNTEGYAILVTMIAFLHTFHVKGPPKQLETNP